MVGEGPGRSENMLGEPFVGEAGYCLKDIVEVCFKQHCTLMVTEDSRSQCDLVYNDKLTVEDVADKVLWDNKTVSKSQQLVTATHQKYPSLRVGYTNLVSCLPLEEPEVEDGFRMLRPPSPEEAKACQGRLLEIIRIVRPKAVVVLGKVPEKLFPKTKDGLPPFVKFVEKSIHPSALVRLRSADPIRYQESYNRTLLILTRLKRKLWGLEE